MEAVEIFLALPLLEDLATVLFTVLFDCIFGRFTVVLLTVLWTFPLSFWRIEELLETDLSFLELGELLLTVVLLFTVPFPLLR